MQGTIIPRIAAVHDLSGFGRCSLSVIIPVLSTMGMQVCPIPTAVLSTHTGGFEGFTFVDLTDTMEKYYSHWKQIGVELDCVYSGFLGSPRQIDLILELIDTFDMRERLIVVDPVFADNGKLYSTFTVDFIPHMRRLIRAAHVITPNITEASLLLGQEIKSCYTANEAKQMLLRLTEVGPDTAVITSMPMGDVPSCVVAYSRRDDRYWKVQCDYLPAEYPGTGDIFTSVLCGALLEGDSLPVAADRAVRFVSMAIRMTFGYASPPREGVLLERVLHTLTKLPDEIRYELL